MAWYRVTEGGVLVKVKVVPRSSKPGIQGVEGDHLRVRLKAPPVEGKANRELVEVLAKALGVSKGLVEIAKGHKSRIKEVLISNLRPEKLEGLL